MSDRRSIIFKHGRSPFNHYLQIVAIAFQSLPLWAIAVQSSSLWAIAVQSLPSNSSDRRSIITFK